VPVIQVPAKDTIEAGRSVRVTSEAVSALAEPFLYLMKISLQLVELSL
jgi:hypothetical protein